MRFNVDYLAVTFHELNGEPLREFCGRWLFERTIWDESLSWAYHDMPGQMWSGRWTYGNGDLTIMVGRRGFECLTLKSRGCEVLQENLGQFCNEVHHHAGRTKCTRTDGAWGPVPFSVHEFYQHLCGPDLVSKQRKHGAEWRDNDWGATAAFPPYEVRADAPRMVRAYDRRGFDRLEVELHDPDADDAFRTMALNDPADWATLWVGYLLRCVDFRDAKSHSEVEKRERCHWWEKMVGDAKK